MKPFSFMHAADLHLDSPFKGITAYSPAIAKSLCSATFDAFESLIRLCIDKQVQVLLIAGDIYDGADRSLRAQLRFRDGLAQLSEQNIRSFVVHGNHDALDGWSSAIEWPAGVHIFGSDKVETVTIELQSIPVATVSGISYPKGDEKRNLSKKFSHGSPDLFQIGLLHCNVGSNTGHEPYAPCELNDLIGVGLNYWALGHVHERAIIHRDPFVVYPGNTQGLSLREQDERGCYLVTVNEKQNVDIRFCPLDSVRWFSVSVGIEAVDTVSQLDSVISKAVDRLKRKADSRPIVCRIILTGRGSLYKELQRENAVLDLLDRTRENHALESPFIWVQKIQVDCRPEIDLKERRKGKDFLGQVLRISHEIRNSGTPTDEALMSTLSDLFKNRRVEKAVGFPSREEILGMLDEAELLCLDKLEIFR